MLSGTRIALDSIVHSFKSGAAPESILRSFPLIGSLEFVYGALTFYLANKDQVEAYMAEQERLWKAVESKQSPLSESLAAKLNATKAGTVLRKA